MNKAPPVVIAHRGDRSRAPENTLAAVRCALRTGADLVEVDVRLSADGALVVIHDRTLERTTTGNGPVSEHTLEELRQLDAGSWYGPEFAGEAIPTLSEAVAVVAGRARLLVELKGEGTGLAAARLMRELDAQAPAFTSFRVEELRAQRSGLPQAEARLLAPEATYQGDDLVGLLNAAEELGCAGLLVSGRHVPAEALERVHARGLEVWVGAVNEEPEWDGLVASGVDGLVSDKPGDLVRYLRRRGRR